MIIIIGDNPLAFRIRGVGFVIMGIEVILSVQDKLQLGVTGFCKQELARPVRYQAELGNGKQLLSVFR